MQAVRQHGFGEPDELRLEEVPDPRPAEGEVRIRVESAGVHLLDTLIRRGQAAGPLPLPQLPMTPGREVAGVVDEVGPGGDPGWLGRRVVADLGPAGGGYAQLVVAPEASLHPIPGQLEADQAVTMLGTGRTAMAILDLAAPSPDDVALVTAAAGGVGTLLVQALGAAGATVVGVAGGPAKTSLVEELGATVAVDYLAAEEGWPDDVREALSGKMVTLACDGVGSDVGRHAFEMLAPGGHLVMYGIAGGAAIELSTRELFARGLTVSSAIGARLVGRTRPLETRALQAAADGRLQPVIGQSFPLAEAAAAHTAVESRATVGKTVLRA